MDTLGINYRIDFTRATILNGRPFHLFHSEILKTLPKKLKAIQLKSSSCLFKENSFRNQIFDNSI